MTKKDENSQEWMFTSYIQKVVIHAKVDYLRHQGRICEQEDLNDELFENITQQEDTYFDSIESDSLEQIASDERMHRAICSLSDSEKKVIYHTCIEELTARETAQLMGTSVSWVQKLKKRALNTLRHALEIKEDSTHE